MYDITIPISNTIPVWPGDPPVRLDRVCSIEKGDPCNVTGIMMGAHTGTHIDAPYHYLQKGATVDAIPLETLNGPCIVVEIDAARHVERADLEKHDLRGSGRVLIKTRNSGMWEHGRAEFNRNFIALTAGAAEYLIEKRVLLVGIDYLSIEPFGSTEHPVHTMLLKNNIIILEGLDLSLIKPSEYELICLPLKLLGTDGAPVRALLRHTVV